jgi:hypothetical protein
VPDLPPPLPPETRTVGQLIAETIRAYGNDFWRVLPLGLPIGVATQVSLGRSPNTQALVLLIFTPLIAAAYLRAAWLVLDARPSGTAYVVAVLVFAPVPFLARAEFVLLGLAWLALFGLAPVAAAVEKLRFRAALARGRRLGTADYVHALGSLSALVIVVVVAELTLIALLRSQGDAGQRVAHGVADLMLTPILYLGGALLYVDQAARAVRSAPDGALHPPLDADPAGHPDPQVES